MESQDDEQSRDLEEVYDPEPSVERSATHSEDASMRSESEGDDEKLLFEQPQEVCKKRIQQNTFSPSKPGPSRQSPQKQQPQKIAQTYQNKAEYTRIRADEMEVESEEEKPVTKINLQDSSSSSSSSDALEDLLEPEEKLQVK